MRVNTRVVSDIRTGKILERVAYQYRGPVARAMGVRFPTVATNTFVGPLPASAAETVVLTTPGISEPIDNAQVLLLWTASITPGTSTTSLVFRLRRGTLATSPLVNVASFGFTTVAANLTTVSGWYFDSPGVVAGQQYSLTVVQTADTVAGAWVDGALVAMVL